MSNRVKAHRERMTAAGWKQSAIWLPPEAVEKLNELSKTRDIPRQEVIIRLILEADSVQQPAPPKPKKKSAAKKKRPPRASSKLPGVQTLPLDAIGLARPATFKDSPTAVSVNQESKDHPTMDMSNKQGAGWRTKPRKFMSVREAKKHLDDFKKTHAGATITQRYQLEDQSILEVIATYTDGRIDHRVIYQARDGR